MLFVIVFSYRFLNLNNVSIWLDEAVQGTIASTQPPLMAGAMQHHPPLDMQFTRLGTQLFGYTELGIRLAPVLFNSLAVVLLYFFLFEIGQSVFIAAILASTFLLHPLVARFGFEARPISLGLFSVILYLYFVSQRFSKNKPHLWFKSDSALLLLTFIFLSSLGLQPLFFVACTLFYMFFQFIFTQKNLKPALSIFIAFILFLPLQVHIMLNSPPRFTKTQGFDLQEILNQFSIEKFYVLNTYLNPFGLVGLFLILIFSIVFLYNLFKNKKHDNNYEFILFLLFILLFFPLTLISVFTSHVAWNMNDYYLIFMMPLVLLFFAHAMILFISLITTRHKNFISLIAIILVTSLFLFFVKRNADPILFNKNYYNRDDARSALTYINEASQDTKSLIILPLCLSSTLWCPGWIIAEPYYLRNDSTSQRNGEGTEVRLKNINKSNVHPNKTFIYFYSNYADKNSNLKHAPEITFNGIQLYRLPPADSYQEWLNNLIEFYAIEIKSGLDRGLLYTGAIDILKNLYRFNNDEYKLKRLESDILKVQLTNLKQTM